MMAAVVNRCWYILNRKQSASLGHMPSREGEVTYFQIIFFSVPEALSILLSAWDNYNRQQKKISAPPPGVSWKKKPRPTNGIPCMLELRPLTMQVAQDIRADVLGLQRDPMRVLQPART